MGSGFLSYAILIEIIVILVAWLAFVHWRLSKKKKELVAVSEVDVPEPLEVYMQFINRELSETLAHLDQLAEDSADTETVTMYQYRLKHLDAEQKAMDEAKGDTVKFWELYRSNIDFVHEVEGEELEEPVAAEAVSTEPSVETRSMQEQLEIFNKKSETILGQSNDVIELIQTFADKNESEELQHIIKLLSGERDELSSQLDNMRNEYNLMMKNIRPESSDDTESAVSSLPRADEDAPNMSGVLLKQNTRISELNNVVGNLSLEIEDKKALIKETEWVTRQLKETEHVVIILEDENSFLRDQIKQLVEAKG